MSIDDTMKQGERICWSMPWSRAFTFIVIPKVHLCLCLHRFLQIASPKVTDSFGKWLEKHPAIPVPCPVLLSVQWCLSAFLNQISWFEVSYISKKYFLATMCYGCWQMENICRCILPICWALPLASPLSPAGHDSGSWPRKRLQYGLLLIQWLCSKTRWIWSTRGSVKYNETAESRYL